MDAISKLLGGALPPATSSTTAPNNNNKRRGGGGGSGYGQQTAGRRGGRGGASTTTTTTNRKGVKSSAASNANGRPGGPNNNNKGGASSGVMGKEDSHRLGLSQHPVVVDANSLKASHQPGKKGGTFSLPGGAKLTVPESLFTKKDVISCRVAAPHTRWMTCPTQLPSYEIVSSEIFTLKSHVQTLKKPVIVKIPFQPISSEYGDINVKGKWTDGSEWINVGFLIKECDNKPCVELELTKLGTFVVTTTPKTEYFDITTQGCLYQARISKHITVRFPKKATDTNLQCALQIHPVPPEKLQLSRELRPIDLADVRSMTEFVDVIGNVPVRFKRAVTVKLPLPEGVDVDVEGGGDAMTSEGHPDIAIMMKTSSTGWEVVESLYKFTRTTVTFDVRELARFCVVQCVPGRQKKMKEAVNIIEGLNNKEKGEVCVFLSFKEKSWRAMVEVIPKKMADTKISDRKAQGFSVVTKVQAPVVEATPPRFRDPRRPAPPGMRGKFGQGQAKDDEFEIYEGVTWLVDIGGDIKTTVQSDLRENNHLRYFSRLSESYRTFDFEPIEFEPAALEGKINLVPMGIRDEALRNKMSFTFKIDIDEAKVIEYITPETVPEEKEPEKPKPALDLTVLPPEPPKPEVPPPAPTTPRVRELPTNVMKRLTTVNRPIRVPDRESRALSGRSLMTLARLIPEGLTLAVHLHLPDSTITGIGFDALSNNLNMSDVSYKILLHWKRKCKDKQAGAIKQLTEALQEMNYQAIADVIADCHQRKKEFTPDCLSHDQIYSRVK